MAISNSIRSLRSHKHPSINPDGSPHKNKSNGSIPPNEKLTIDKDEVVSVHTDSGIKSTTSKNPIDRQSSIKPTVFSRLSARLSIIRRPVNLRLDHPKPSCPSSTDLAPTPPQLPPSSLRPSSSKLIKRNKSLEIDAALGLPGKDFSLVDDQQLIDGSLTAKDESPESYRFQSTRSVKSQPRASLFFWKRVSQSTPALDLIDKSHEQQLPQAQLQSSPKDAQHPIDLGHGQEMVIHTSASSDGHPSSVTSSDMSETLSSSAVDTNETSVCIEELDDEVFDQESGLAGIGVRDRRSISLFSLPIQIKYNHYLDPTGTTGNKQVLLAKPIHHPGMRYAPSNSSPLSSRPQSPADLSNPIAINSGHPRTVKADSDVNRRSSPALSAHHRPHRHPRRSSDRPSSRVGQLNIVPSQQSCDASQDLMRLLRGPSSYPAETLPRCSSRSSYVCV